MALEQIVTRTDAAALFSAPTSARVSQHVPIPILTTNCDFTDCRPNNRNERLTAWFETWRGAMCRWLSSRSSIQEADLDDVAQEVFLRLLRYSDDAVVDYPQSYLFRIAVNVVNEWRERARNRLPHGEEGLETLEIESHDEPEHSVDRTLRVKRVQSAVNRLPTRQRQVLLLHINDDLTYKQIAAKLKLSPRIVRRDIAHAYAQLRDDLREESLGGLARLRLLSPERDPVEHVIQ